jgi:hypothetical protein
MCGCVTKPSLAATPKRATILRQPTMMVVYNLLRIDAIFERFGGIAGS